MVLVAVGIIAVGSALLIWAHLRTQPSSPDRSAARVALGRKLFFDKGLSADGKTSCSSCHQPQHAYSDTRAISRGALGKEGTRNAPGLLTVTSKSPLFWDGRRSELRHAVLDPFLNPAELALANQSQLLAKLQGDDYRRSFTQAFGAPEAGLRIDHAGQALEAFIQSIPRPVTKFDRFQASPDKHRLSTAAAQGFRLFVGKAGCATCHTASRHPARFTDDKFHSTGTGLQAVAGMIPAISSRLATQRVTDVAALGRTIDTDPQVAALGRFVKTLRPGDIGQFRTPSLRYVADSAPYMHDGSVKDLDSAVDQEIYWRSLKSGKPLLLTVNERKQLVAFLRTLSPQASP